MDDDMAKRGRPPKPKIEAFKNPVGRPFNKKLPARTIEIIYRWIWLSVEQQELTQTEKKSILMRQFNASLRTIEGAITEWNRTYKRGYRPYLTFDTREILVVTPDQYEEMKIKQLLDLNPYDDVCRISP